jgi:hypothetical protein
MYTGIVHSLEKVVNIQQGDNFTTLIFPMKMAFK